MSDTPRHIGESQAEAILREAADRNSTVDITLTEGDARPITARARLLEVTDSQVCIDRPTPALRTAPETPITIAFMHNGARFVFKAVVANPHATIEMNGARRVSGVALRLLGAYDGQRRNAFRVESLRGERIRATLHTAMPWRHGAAPISASRLSTLVLDLSMGGAGIEIQSRSAQALKVNDAMFIRLELPDTRAIAALVRVCQITPCGDGTVARLGLQFAPWPDARALERQLVPLQRFITETQRARLRRAG